MNIDTATNLPRVTLDTNIIISGIGFRGKPRKILELALEKKIETITSPVLLAELEDVIAKKFPALEEHFDRINKQIRKKFKTVRPRKTFKILEDEDDNRVLEAATEGSCSYIITGDKELLRLGSFGNIRIKSANEFLKILKISEDPN